MSLVAPSRASILQRSTQASPARSPTLGDPLLAADPAESEQLARLAALLARLLKEQASLRQDINDYAMTYVDKLDSLANDALNSPLKTRRDSISAIKASASAQCLIM